MGPGDKPITNPAAMDKLAPDGSDWPLWQATILTIFKSKNLLKHIQYGSPGGGRSMLGDGPKILFFIVM